MLNRRPAADSINAAALPAAAFRACRYADWTDGTVCRLPRQVSQARLPEAEHRLTVARASSRVDQTAPRYRLPDTYNLPLYAAPAAPSVPALPEWQAQVLAAVRCLRRWRYLDNTGALPAPVSGPHPNCLCRRCLRA